MAVLTKYGFVEVADVIRSRFTLGPSPRMASAAHISKNNGRAVRARLAMEELGPIFVKLGQLLSTRPDLIPDDYVKEFETLQDHVAADDFDSIRAEIEQQLGGKLKDFFLNFEKEPIAAGSIAQVHRAVTVEGISVAVKVRRPGIKQAIRTECEILQDLGKILKATVFKNETIDPLKMANEFNEAVSGEVNLNVERQNQLRFQQNFADDPSIHVPNVYEKYCAEGVLTMEYIDGVKPNDKNTLEKFGLDAKIVANRAANFVLRQIFEFGFFHTDPHPGNFLVLPDNVLVPLDFGQAAHLSLKDRKLLNEIILSIVDNEAVEMVEALEQDDMVSEKTDINKFTRDTEKFLDAYYGRPLKEIPFSRVISQIFDLFRNNQVNPPAQFTLMLKCLATIESFACTLDPEFQIIEQLKPYARQFSLRDIDFKQILRETRRAIQGAGSLASRLPDDVTSILSKFRQGKFQLHVHHEHLESLVKTLDKSSNRISFALIIAALLVGSSLLVPQEGMVLGFFTLQALGIVGYITAAVIGFWLIISIIRSRHF
jgi:ubiquinone biosynthesis protein